MILDVSAVDVFETVALGVIFEAVKRSRSRSGSIVLVNPSDRMSNDLEITGACRILDVTLTVQDAVARLQCVSGG